MSLYNRNKSLLYRKTDFLYVNNFKILLLIQNEMVDKIFWIKNKNFAFLKFLLSKVFINKVF